MSCPCGNHTLDRAALEAKHGLNISDEDLTLLEECVCSLSFRLHETAHKFGMSLARARVELRDADYFDIQTMMEVRLRSGGKGRGVGTYKVMSKYDSSSERRGLLVDFIRSLFAQTGGVAPSARTIQRAVSRRSYGPLRRT